MRPSRIAGALCFPNWRPEVSGLRFGKRRAYQQVVGKSEEGHSTCCCERCCIIETASFHVIRYQPALEGPEDQTVHLYTGAHVRFQDVHQAGEQCNAQVRNGEDMTSQACAMRLGQMERGGARPEKSARAGPCVSPCPLER